MSQLNVDCLVLIFDEIQDKKSLHSCLLVNREWCHLVVPILWRKYSWWTIRKKSKREKSTFFNTIISFLPSSSKQLLSDNNIKSPTTILLKPPLFNYISFCEFPGSFDIYGIINIVFGVYYEKKNGKKNILEQEIYKLFVSQCKNIKKLEWATSQPLSLFPGASTCFSQLNSLLINFDYMDSSALYEMAQICKDLKELTFYYSREFPGLISLIDAQKNLSKVSIFKASGNNSNTRGTYYELSKALARKSSTINILNLCLGIIPSSLLTSLVNLTYISIYVSSFDIDKIKEFQQYLAISEFPNLQSLSFSGPSSCFKEIAILIGKTRGNILRVHISGYEIKVPTNTGMAIESIANNCPKIKFLHMYLRPIDFIYVKLLLLNCKHLEDIGFGIFNIFMKEDEGDELLDILTKFSPKSLTKISFSTRYWRYSTNALERLFESYRERSLDSFNTSYITESHKSIIKKYINEGVIKNYKKSYL